MTGAPRELKMPGLCANCGAAAKERIRVRKKFTRDSDEGPDKILIVEAYPPLCGDCLRRHEAEEERVSFAGRILLCFRSGMMIGAAVTFFGALFFLYILGPGIGSGNRVEFLFGAGLPGFFAAISLVFVALAWRDSEHLTVKPLTSVAQAFDFSDDVSKLFEPARRRYTLRNAEFAEEFGRLNADKVWVRSGTRAQRAHLLRWVAFALFLAAGVVVIVLDAMGKLPD